MRAGLLVIVLAAYGCNDPTYLGENAPIETQPAMMGGGFAPATGLYVLPVRQPTQTERQALQKLQQQLMLPDAVPWAQARDFDIEIEWSVKNLDSMKATVIVALDGGNEFGDYVPGAYIDPNANAEDQTPPPDLLDDGAARHRSGRDVVGRLPRGRSAGVGDRSRSDHALSRRAATRWRRRSWSSSIARASRSIGLEGVPPNDVTPAHVRYAVHRQRRRARHHGLHGARARSQRQAGQADRQEPLRQHRRDCSRRPIAPPMP